MYVTINNILVLVCKQDYISIGKQNHEKKSPDKEEVLTSKRNDKNSYSYYQSLKISL